MMGLSGFPLTLAGAARMWDDRPRTRSKNRADSLRREDAMQDGQLREDAKQLLRVAYEQRSVRGAEGMQVDLADAARARGLTHGSPHLGALVDYMEVMGWVEEDPVAHNI